MENLSSLNFTNSEISEKFHKFQNWYMKINEQNYFLDFEISKDVSESIQKNFLENSGSKNNNKLWSMTIDDFDRSLNLTKLYCLSKGKKNMQMEDYEYIRQLELNRLKDIS